MNASQKAHRAADIVRDAGGRVVGRTRLQKISYLLYASGLEADFNFIYKHYGPFSDELAQASRIAQILDILAEEEHATTWGGTYSVFSTAEVPPAEVPEARREIAALAARADAIELELAATAVFLSKEGFENAWLETARRKPDKADHGRLERAKALYEALRNVRTPLPLPVLV